MGCLPLAVTTVPPVLAAAVAAPPRRTPWKRRLLWLGGAAALLLATLMAVRAWSGPQVPAWTVVQRPLVQTLVASGQVRSPHRVSIGAQVTGTVVQVPVEDGQTVAAGAPLLLLDDREARAALGQADLAVVQAQARLRQLREVDEPVAELARSQAQANHDTAQRALQRNRELQAQGFIGQAALDESARAAEVARTQWRSAEQQLIAARHGGSAEATALAALQAAQAAAQAARARLAYTVVRAPVAGTLIGRSVEAGDVVQPGKVLMVLAPASAPQLVVQIDEKNLHLLQPGQAALASADAAPRQRFAARVAYVHPGVDAQRGSVETRLDIMQPPGFLRQDMTVSVDIEVARRASALLVPAEAVRGLDTGAPWVLQVEAGRVVRKPVQLGLRSAGWCEVLAGLGAGDTVLPASATATEGARVRPVPQAR